MKLFFYRLLFLFSLGILFPVYQAQATHLRASEIRVERLNCTSLTFRMTVMAYTNTALIVRFSDHGNGVLDFGDVSNGFVDPVEQKKKCTRFVSKVDFKVFNRWESRCLIINRATGVPFTSIGVGRTMTERSLLQGFTITTQRLFLMLSIRHNATSRLKDGGI